MAQRLDPSDLGSAISMEASIPTIPDLNKTKSGQQSVDSRGRLAEEGGPKESLDDSSEESKSSESEISMLPKQDGMIDFQLKFVGRYVPHVSFNRAPSDSMQGIATKKTELEKELAAFMGGDGSTISNITFDSGLSRMTTIRKVFENFDVDINNQTFRDLYASLVGRRDLSAEAVQAMYSNQINTPLRED